MNTRIGDKYGSHRVIEPKGQLPQAAYKLSNDLEIFDNEILIKVIALNIDSASFKQIWKEQEEDHEKVAQKISQIVADRGKMQNPVTGSGGMLIGTVEKIGDVLKPYTDLKIGDRIATLVSLSLTPLVINKILSIEPEKEKVRIEGYAILFESGIYAKLPSDLDENLALAVLDVCGAPAQTKNLVHKGDSVLILGATGKSGLLCAYVAKKLVGSEGKVIGLVTRQQRKDFLEPLGLCDEIIIGDAQNPLEILEKTMAVNDGKFVDLSINVVNVPNTEMATILPVKEGGIVYFFSMATSFTKAALGAEGIGKDVQMIIGNGYTRGHAQFALNIMYKSPMLLKIFTERFVK